VTLATYRSYDCVYSNKVLHHLIDDDLQRSLERQSLLLKDGGYAMHSFWSGEGDEEMHGLKFHCQSEDKIRTRFDQDYEIVSLVTYEELESEDSTYVLARVQS